MNEDPKDPKKETEDELKKLIEELESYQKHRKTNIAYTFLLHKNYVIHMLLSFLVNLLMGATVIGLSQIMEYQIVEMTLLGFLFATILLTLIENFVKILLFKYALRVMLYSLGMMSWLVQLVILYGVTLILGETFEFLTFWNLMIYSLLFTIMRFILSVYLRRWLFQKDRIFIGGKK